MTHPAAATDPVALAASLTQWWALAGVDVAVQDMPRSWLAKPKPAGAPAVRPAAMAPPSAPSGIAVAPPPPPVKPVAAPMPDTLDGFLHWLAEDEGQPEAAFSQHRILPRALPSPDLMVITDMPTQEDMAAGQLFSGADSRLLSGMARAIGMAMDRIAMASLLLARPAGGIIDDALLHHATSRLDHFLKLVAPRAVILLGDRTSRALEQTDGGNSPLSPSSINRNGVIVSAMALPAPFVLLKHPERKVAAWAQLRHIAKR